MISLKSEGPIHVIDQYLEYGLYEEERKKNRKENKKK